MSWCTKRIQPLQHRDRLMFQYTWRDDNMRASKDNLFGDALDKRIRVMIKIPRGVHTHVSLEEKDLGNLTWVPHSGNTHPEAALDAEAPEAPAPAKRKRATASGPASKRAREAPSIKATKKAEKEKIFLSHIDTSKSWQPNIEQFFGKSGKITGSKPPKKKSKPSPASMPETPEVEVPPKASSSTTQILKDVINLDDIPEDPAADSGKGASSSKPPLEEPENTSAEATANDAGKKLLLSGATDTPKTHPRFFPVLQKVSLAQRHAETKHLMNEVWGKLETEQQDLATLEDNLRVFFAKHKAVRQAEIEKLMKKGSEDQQAISLLETRLKNNEEKFASLPSIDDISAELKVFKSEHASLQQSLKESHEKETKTKKELEEKHALAIAEMAEKLKASQQRVKTLVSKTKNYEEESKEIDEMIFHKDFMFSDISILSILSVM
ncbi:hypothetical protein QYE76_067577 [Lolium multiflorum]|uniref:Uncharacterized protein n=1 Tax=Lolium multiflorum TaxID=4521 RepID=A0AAD8WD50_LOLMU|nr:hypothetical protein QYE76_067577 [Lolium multiflorum]